jgi:hypothetical protein
MDASPTYPFLACCNLHVARFRHRRHRSTFHPSHILLGVDQVPGLGHSIASRPGAKASKARPTRRFEPPGRSAQTPPKAGSLLFLLLVMKSATGAFDARITDRLFGRANACAEMVICSLVAWKSFFPSRPTSPRQLSPAWRPVANMLHSRHPSQWATRTLSIWPSSPSRRSATRVCARRERRSRRAC